VIARVWQKAAGRKTPLETRRGWASRPALVGMRSGGPRWPSRFVRGAQKNRPLHLRAGAGTNAAVSRESSPRPWNPPARSRSAPPPAHKAPALQTFNFQLGLVPQPPAETAVRQNRPLDQLGATRPAKRNSEPPLGQPPQLERVRPETTTPNRPARGACRMENTIAAAIRLPAEDPSRTALVPSGSTSLIPTRK